MITAPGQTRPVITWGLWQSPALNPADRSAIALELALQVLTWNQWVAWRIDRVELLGFAEFRRVAIVDLAVPESTWVPGDPVVGQLMQDHDGSAIVPLALIPKRHLLDFTTADEAGSTLPVLTRTESAALTHVLLKELWRAADPGNEIPIYLDSFLQTISTAGPQAAQVAFNEIEARRSAGMPSLTPVARVVLEVTRSLAHNSILFLLLPQNRGGRRVLRYSFRDVATPRRSWSAWAARWINLRPMTLEFSGVYGIAANELVEIPMPLGVKAAAVRMYSAGAVSRPRVGLAGARAAAPSFPYLAPPSPEAEFGTDVEVDMWLSETGLIRQALIVSALVTGLLTTGLAIHLSGSGRPGSGAAGLIAALPGAIALYVAAQSNPVAERLSAGVRLRALLCGTVALAAGGTLAIDQRSPGLAATIWLGLLLVSVATTVFLGMNWLTASMGHPKPKQDGDPEYT